MIGHAREAEAARPLGITYRVGSFSTRTGLPAAAFDAVIAVMALMDAPDLQGAMQETVRLLRPGGFVAFSVLHPAFVRPPVTERWRFAARPSCEGTLPFDVPRFPRTLADDIDTVAAAGFTIRRIDEPQPTEDVCASVPRFARWRDHAAFVLHLLAERPER